MDTRQLAAFCAVVERRSLLAGGRAARRHAAGRLAPGARAREAARDAAARSLGPARRADRGGTRGSTAAPSGSSRSRSRCSTRSRRRREGELTGSLSIGASTGPAAVVVPQLLCEFQRAHPAVRVALEVHDTRTVVELVAERRLELGIVGAAPRHRAVRFEPFAYDEVVLVCPPGHRFAGRDVDVARARVRDACRHAGGRRRSQDRRGRAPPARASGCATSTCGSSSACRSRCGAPCSPGYGVTFISRAAVESDLAAGALAEARVEGMDGRREISLARGTGACADRVADAFVGVRTGAAPDARCLRTTVPRRARERHGARADHAVRRGLARGARGRLRRGGHRAPAARHDTARSAGGASLPVVGTSRRRPAARARRDGA